MFRFVLFCFFFTLKGSECSFRHDRSALVKKAICRFYVLSADNCQLGDDCAFMHNILFKSYCLLPLKFKRMLYLEFISNAKWVLKKGRKKKTNANLRNER